MSSLTAWRFDGTEEADDAVLKLKRLDDQKLIDVQDVAVIRWPEHASGPSSQEHVTREGGMFQSIAKRMSHSNIDSATVESVKGDMMPGTSAVVLLSDKADPEAVTRAFEGKSMELIRSDLSVQQEDQARRTFGDQADDQQSQPPQSQPPQSQPPQSQPPQSQPPSESQ